MDPQLISFLAAERNADRLAEAERERLRRAAAGARPQVGSRPRWRPRIHLRIPPLWIPRPAG